MAICLSIHNSTQPELHRGNWIYKYPKWEH